MSDRESHTTCNCGSSGYVHAYNCPAGVKGTTMRSETAEVISLTDFQRSRIMKKVLDLLIPVIIAQSERERLAKRVVEWILS